MEIEDGDVLTDNRNAICKCCGRRMTFTVKTLDQPWGKFYLRFGCMSDPITTPCPCDTDIPCDENADCPITTDEVRSLADYYVNFFQNLLINYHWQTVSFELIQDVLLNQIIQTILQRNIPCCTISIPFSYIIKRVDNTTGKKTEYPQTQLQCFIIANTQENLPANGIPFSKPKDVSDHAE